MRIPFDIEQRIEKTIAELSPRWWGHANYEGVTHHALPLMGTIGEVWMLRPDGTFWRSDVDAGLELEALPEEFHTLALVYGVGTFPRLQRLLPTRRSDAGDCSKCKGAGRFLTSQASFGFMLCHACHGLGWVVPA